MTKEIKIGRVTIGGKNPIVIQSMTNTKTEDIKASLEQIRALEELGCEMVRLSANTEASAKAFRFLKEETDIPLIADIHFNQKLAILALENGADKIRINPGNMPESALDEIIHCAKEYHKPIRIGVNSGSIQRDIVDKMGVTPESMYLSLARSIALFEERGFYDLVLSAKSSSVKMNIETNRKIHEHFDYPIHLGVTEAGTYDRALVKSAIGIGSLLADGIGDTIRVSITGSPLEEIPVAQSILESLGLRKGLNIISCPTCARTNVNLLKLVKEAETALKGLDCNKTIAIMGCAVNGPGEAREADYGIAGGDGVALLFKKGEIIGKYREDQVVEELLKLLKEEL
ncbi:flavodoxin-dependent (E)-4-hydroxy-3-methylbut-2-enyl-diphosphate synthase [Guggenheimella bovis]